MKLPRLILSAAVLMPLSTPATYIMPMHNRLDVQFDLPRTK